MNDELKEMAGTISLGSMPVECTEEILNRWNNLGLLEGITDDELRRKIALKYEQAAWTLFHSEEEKPECIEMYMFPAIRRLMPALGDVDIKDLMGRMYHFYTLFNDKVHELIGENAKSTGEPIDVEANVFYMFCATYFMLSKEGSI